MNKSKIKFYFPRWIFPNNLGDSLICTFVPKILKKIYPNSELEIITYGFLIDLFKLNPHVDIVREPNEQERYLNFQQYAFSEQQEENIKVIYPDWHPKVFSFWKEHFKMLEDHPTANIITVNYLLQLRLEHLLFDKDINFLGSLDIESNPNTTNFINIGIVPTTKLSGKTNPHPDCDGKGFRFNGMKGLESWKELVSTMKNLNDKIKIFEFSKENFGLGDHHFEDDGNIFTLIKNVDFMDFGIMSDGGIHHAFNIRNKPVVLFQACLINKVEFFKLGNAFFPEHLHLECRKHCPSYFLQSFGGENKSLSCKRECENLSSKSLAEYIIHNVIK
jgi:hypothetical protein